jgi:hypothetical protein
MLQELLLETDRNRSAKERTEQAAKAAREAAEATQRHEKELQVRLKILKKKCFIRLLLVPEEATKRHEKELQVQLEKGEIF